jgi:hypothetical protein
MSGLLRRVATKTWEAVHAFWLIIGVSLAILLVMEACTRVARTVGERRRGHRIEGVVPGDPQSSANWFADFVREYDDTRPQRWKSYVYFGRKPGYRGRYINIDSAGHRVTPQPTSPARPFARVFFFGGSTMWGTAQRDSQTIAAEAARRLQSLAGPGQRIEVTNFGESGYVSTQDLLSLMLELRAGNIPDVVVFYDGINDVGTTIQYGAPGLPQNESKRVAEFDMGRAIDRSSFEHGLRKDLRAWKVLGDASLKQLALYGWVQSLNPKIVTSFISADSAARSTARLYAENMRIVEALAQRYGFTPIYVWQPSLHGTAKKLTAFEDRLMAGIDRDPFQRRTKETQLAITGMLDSAMAHIAPDRFVDASQLFKGDTMAVYVDRIGHNTEASVPRIVDAFWSVLSTAVERRAPASAMHSTATARAR